MPARKIQPLRRAVHFIQATIIVGLPFIKFNGQSVLLFNVRELKLQFFGTDIWMEEFFLVLLGILFMLFALAWVTLVFGRIWCGWLCPQTLLMDLTSMVDKARTRPPHIKYISWVVVLFISTLSGAVCVWYFVSPYEFFASILDGTLSTNALYSWAVISGVVFGDMIFLRHGFCSTACPYAKLQGMMFDNNTLIIAFDKSRIKECHDCKACVRVCPVGIGIDIRKGMNIACMSCAECVDKCGQMIGMASMGKKTSLINYFYGDSGGKANLLRPASLITALVALLLFTMLIVFTLGRTEISLTVLPNNNFPPRVTAKNKAVNSYILAITNKGNEKAEIKINALGYKISPSSVMVMSQENHKVIVYVVADDALPSENIEIELRKNNKIIARSKIAFIRIR